MRKRARRRLCEQKKQDLREVSRCLRVITFASLLPCTSLLARTERDGFPATPPAGSQWAAAFQGSTRASPAPASSTEDEFFSQVDLLIAERKLDEAERLLERYLVENAQSPGALYRLGRIHFDRHDWEQATEFLNRSLRLFPHNDRARLILGLCHFQLGRIPEAEKELLTAVRLNPSSDENQYMAGRLFMSCHKRTEALIFLYEAARLNPGNFKALHNIGVCLQNLGNYRLAEHYYRRAIAVAESQDVQFAQAYIDLADLLSGTEGSWVAGGEIVARRATELAPESALAYLFFGRALYRQGKFKEALTPLIKASELDPASAFPHFLMGKIYQKLGEQSKAEAAWTVFRRLSTGRDDPPPGRRADQHGPP